MSALILRLYTHTLTQSDGIPMLDREASNHRVALQAGSTFVVTLLIICGALAFQLSPSSPLGRGEAAYRGLARNESRNFLQPVLRPRGWKRVWVKGDASIRGREGDVANTRSPSDPDVIVKVSPCGFSTDVWCPFHSHGFVIFPLEGGGGVSLGA